MAITPYIPAETDDREIRPIESRPQPCLKEEAFVLIRWSRLAVVMNSQASCAPRAVWCLVMTAMLLTEVPLLSAQIPSAGPSEVPGFSSAANTGAHGRGENGKRPIDRSKDHPSSLSGARTSPWKSLAILGVMIGLILLAGKGLKRLAPHRFHELSDDLFTPLGYRSLSRNHTVHLVRVGQRLLLIGSSSEGLRTLSEITDPEEVIRLTDLATRAAGKPPARAARDAGAQTSGQISDSSGINPEDLLPPEKTGHTSRTSGSRLGPLSRRVAIVLFALCLGTSQLAAELPESRSARSDRLQILPASSRRHTPPEVPSVRDAVDHAAEKIEQNSSRELPSIQEAFSPQGIWPTVRLAALFSVVSLAPAILVMTTCYVRIYIVLGLLRQALGVAQFPPNQVLAGLSLFVTALVMWPIWTRAYEEGIRPYTENTYLSKAEQDAALENALTATVHPIREFMSRQIEATGNEAALDLFATFSASREGTETAYPEYYEDVSLRALLPAFLLSELKTAFLIGVQIFLPFLVIDLVVSSLLSSLGLVTLAPTVVSLPLKLLLFVMIDGWFLTVEVLLNSIAV